MLVLNQDSEKISMLKKPSQARSKMGVVIVCILVVVGGALFWLTTDKEVKENIQVKAVLIKDTVVKKITEVVKENPDNSVVSLVANAKSENLSTLIGTNQVDAKMAASAVIMQAGLSPLSIDPNFNMTVNADETLGISLSEMSSITPSITSNITPNIKLNIKPNIATAVVVDSVVSLKFLDDLAQLMVSRYNPKDNSVNLGIKSINMRYGTTLNGLKYKGQDLFIGREYILRYVFSPNMLSGLYKLYANKFINQIVVVAAQPREVKALNKAQLNAMLKVYAKKVASLAKILTNISHISDLQAKIDSVQQIKLQSMNVRINMNEAIFALDIERDNGNSNSAKIRQLEKNINNLNAEYIKSIKAREQVQNDFVKSIRSQGVLNSVDDESLVYVAYWVSRRLEKQDNALESVTVAGKILNDFSALLKKSASR